MNEKQFALQQEMLEMIFNKLEEIRWGLIDVEDEIQKSSQQGQSSRPDKAQSQSENLGDIFLHNYTQDWEPSGG